MSKKKESPQEQEVDEALEATPGVNAELPMEEEQAERGYLLLQ